DPAVHPASGGAARARGADPRCGPGARRSEGLAQRAARRLLRAGSDARRCRDSSGAVSTAIVVPGHHGPERLVHLVRATEPMAGTGGADVVVFTGWARRGGVTEAEQMHAAWRGPEVELVVEPTATVTAENATRTVPLLLARGVRRAFVVCAPLHLYRTRFFFT